MTDQQVVDAGIRAYYLVKVDWRRESIRRLTDTDATWDRHVARVWRETESGAQQLTYGNIG